MLNKPTNVVLIILLYICISIFDTPVQAAKRIQVTANEYQYVPGQIIVKFNPTIGIVKSSSELAEIMHTANAYNAKPLFKRLKHRSTLKKQVIDLSRIYTMNVPTDADIKAICSQLNRKSFVEYAEPNYFLPVDEVPNDPDYTIQHHLDQIHMPEAWDIAKGDRSVIIAILDTGVDWDHPDLADNIWQNPNETVNGEDTDGNGYVDDIRGWDWVEDVVGAAVGEDSDTPDNNPMDFEGHGTHLAGCAAAVTNNGIGVSGVSWNCNIMSLRVGWKPAGGQGLIRMDWAVNAIIYATDNGANVINISFGTTDLVADAARYAFDNGVVVCESAGNSNSNNPDPTDILPITLSIAAMDDQDFKASYSDFGEWVDISAPGGDLNRGRPGIWSTHFDDEYDSFQGTSFSSPIVAGLAGLMKSYNSDWTNVDIMLRIVETADDIDHLNEAYAGELGSGRINAYRALTESVSPKARLSFVSFEIDDSVAGDGNDILDAGETANLIIQLENSWGDATNVTATLSVDDWAVAVTKDNVSFPDISGLRDLNNNVADNSLDPFVLQIDPAALPHRVPMTVLVTDGNGVSEQFEFVLGISSSILVVDDDDGDNNVQDYYELALDSLGYAYDYWNHFTQGTPVDLLSSYSTVIWLCEWSFPSLDSLDRVEISNYLDNGGHLFLSGQDIGWDLCDEPAPGQDDNENVSSQGASRIFYENYFRAQYLSDDSDYSSLVGVSGDPISDGLSFNVFQPGRDAAYQYPSEIMAIDDGIPILNYPNGLAGAVRYAGDYRVVYFSFGGYEAIVQEEPRAQILPRVLNWLNSITILHEPLGDTEDSFNDYQVVAEISSEGTEISVVDLHWDVDGEMPYHKVPMENNDEGRYTANIPAQTDTTITYTIFVKAANGYTAALKYYSFRVGTDLEAPEFTEVTGLNNTLDKNGPYELRVSIRDNMGVDPNSVYLHYGKIGASKDSIRLALDETLNQFYAIVPGGYAFGDRLVYYLTATDIAMALNRAATRIDTITIGLEDFESGLDNWSATPGTWGLEITEHYSGEYSVNDNPGGILLPNINATLTTRFNLDFSTTNHATLSIWSQHFLRPDKDYGYIEISNDGGAAWEQIGEVFRSIKNSWYETIISLDYYCGAGFDDVRLRFRLQTDPSYNPNFCGWYLDDVRIQGDVENEIAEMPFSENILASFNLGQNFPNPFNPSTNISFDIPKTDRVKLEIYNLLGQRIRVLINERMSAGRHQVFWHGIDDHGEVVSSGVYLYRLEGGSGHFVETRKLVLMR